MTQVPSPIVVGVYQSEVAAKNAVNALRNAGFSHDQIGVALREGGIVTKALLQDLLRLGVPQDEASYYDREYEAGRAIVSVRADGREQEARAILRNSGAYDYYTQGGFAPAASTDLRQSASPGQMGAPQPPEAARPYETEEERVMKLRAEQLRIEKERVQAGEVQLRKEVVTEQQTFNVPVSHEEVVVERHSYPEGRVSEIPVGEDEIIRIPVSKEQVHVTKTPVETGEVTVGKREVQEEQQVGDTVRREEARLEREGEPRVRTDEDLEREREPRRRTNEDLEQP